jgi:uncharacterized membrane protein YgaE (UPF0421/DUF939 family)
MATKKNTTQKKEGNPLDTIRNFFETVTENVIDGATIVSEKIKDNSAKAYVASTELVEDINEKIHLYTDKVSLQKEQTKIQDRQAVLTNAFGALSLQHYLKNDSLHKSFLTTKAVSTLVDEFKANEKNLNTIEKKLNKLNS